ncbi:MBL fold metallo-hydrolase [Pontibacterium sp.]|uniref:MBL fold metallo-hydrolase n=1 Tax=Pontibacterium sp. TaxID=2036026 RepID=UPI0035132BCB
MVFKKVGIALAAALISGQAFWVQAENHGHKADAPAFRTTPVSEQVLLLQGKGGNIALLKGDQGMLLVDDDYRHLSPALKEELNRQGGLDALTYVINTHWHGDHTQGNLALGEHARIVAHDNVRTRLLTRQEIKLFNMVSEPYPESAVPSLTYDSTLTLHMNGETVKLVHYPGGHTDGDTVVFFDEANVVHTGDHFFNGFFPFVDVDSGGNVLQMADNVKAILDRINDDTRIIPGHGPLANKADLQAFHEMLVGTAAEVKAMKDQGMNLGQIQLKGLSDRWDAWADGFLSTRVWIGIVYASL